MTRSPVRRLLTSEATAVTSPTPSVPGTVGNEEGRREDTEGEPCKVARSTGSTPNAIQSIVTLPAGGGDVGESIVVIDRTADGCPSLAYVYADVASRRVSTDIAEREIFDGRCDNIVHTQARIKSSAKT